VKHGYTLDNAWAQARDRLSLLETVCDPGSIRHLEVLGVGEGWHCVDVGAGVGSIVRWLCEKVGATGRVLATDINTRFLEELPYSNLDVRRHDITTEELPEATFDLVHARSVLFHLADRKAALQFMVRALKPAGWLLVEEADFASWLVDPRFGDAELFAKGSAAIRQVMTAAGSDCYYGRRLYRDVLAAGLVDVDAEGRVPTMRADTPLARFWQLSFLQLRDRIDDAGLLTVEEGERFLALHDDPDFTAMMSTVVAVWGRKP
jgi:SAM-dependent methyltransferase